MTTSVSPPLTLTILRQGERLLMDLAEVGTLIPRGETRVDDAFLREVTTELRLLATPGFSSRERRESREAGSVPPPAPGMRRALKRLGGLLFSHLFPEPARVRLRAASPGDLYLRLDEQLLALPWELAYDGQDFLATKFAVGRQVITSQPLPGTTSAPVGERPLKVLLIADPTESLPQAAAEVEQLCTLLEEVPGVEVTLLGGKNVRKLSLLAAVQEHAVVHFAGHSVYDPKAPGESGWRLHEGILTARELGKLTHPPQLVFSNSCQAGATTGWTGSPQVTTQDFGLGSAFLLAGVSNYIGPCWVVDDAESVEFALVFYRAVAAGQSLGAALRQARQASLMEHQTVTLTWASYVLYGDPTIFLLPADDVLQPSLAKDSALTVSASGLSAEVPVGQSQPGQALQARPRSQRHRWRLVIGLLLALGVSGLAVVWFLIPSLLVPLQLSSRPQPAPSLPLPDKPSIVVLPFVNMSGDPEQEYFSDGLTEVLTGDLSKLSGLFVIARNSAFTYKGKAVKVQDIGREMGVRYVLEGSVLKANEQVRITVQLIDATTGYHLWAERYDRSLQDLFTLQDEIVQKIVTTLGLQLTLRKQGHLVRKRTDNLEAYDVFLRGLGDFWRETKEASAHARQMFEKAIAIDPQYAEAYAWLGLVCYRQWTWGWGAESHTLEQASALAQQAVVLDDSLPVAHSLLSFVYAQQQQYDQAIAEGERAIALDPNHAESYAMQAEALNFAGRPEEARQRLEQAMRLNPRYPPVYEILLGWTFFLTGRYTEAVATLKEARNRSPNNPAVHYNLAFSYLQQWAFQLNSDPQILEQAGAAVQHILTLHGSSSGPHMLLGYAYLLQKQYEPALAEMERAITIESSFVSADTYAFLAEALSRAGRPEDALRMVEQALRHKSTLADSHFGRVGTAYALAGRPREAIAALQQYLTRYPNHIGFHVMLAAAYSELGKEAEAQAEAAEVLRLNPNFSLEMHQQRTPIKDPATLERHLIALRKTGLK